MPCGMMRFGPGLLSGGGTLINDFATSLTPFAGRIVIDRTGLTGAYQVDLKWTPEQLPQSPAPPGAPPVDPNGPSLFTALQEQMGLKLDSTRAPVDVVVVDHVEQPTPD